jgi:hypothetical protein
LDRKRTFIQQHLWHAPPAMVIPPSSSSNPWMFMDIDDVDDAAVPSQHAEKLPHSAGDMHEFFLRSAS